MEIRSFWLKNNTVDNKLIYRFPDITQKAYLRITRYASLDICHAETSFDGKLWHHTHDLPMKMSGN